MIFLIEKGVWRDELIRLPLIPVPIQHVKQSVEIAPTLFAGMIAVSVHATIANNARIRRVVPALRPLVFSLQRRVQWIRKPYVC